MEFCSEYGYNYGFHGSDSEELSDEEINSHGKFSKASSKLTKQNFRKADSNIIAVRFDKLDKPNATSFIKPNICKECTAIMSLLSKVKKEENTIEWKCEFCETINNFESNFFVDLGERNKEDITYLLNETQKISNNENTYLIFCIDVSGSMNSCSNKDANKGIGRGISILEEVKRACIINLEKLELEQPNIKVGLVTFSQNVKFYGDCSSDTPYICNELSDKGKLLKLAQDHNGELMIVSRSKNNILNRIKQICTDGNTALGPGLVFSIGFSGKIPGSEVILCTDGKANVGMGSNDINFYDKLADDAKQRGVRVNVITIDGSETDLSILGKIADKSNGLVNMVEPKNITKNFKSIIDNKIIATNVKVKLIVDKKLMYVRDEESEIAKTKALAENDIDIKEKLNKTKISVCEKDIGNVNIDSEITFEYGIRRLNLNDQILDKMPFQLQISFTLKTGYNAKRVYSKIQQFKSDRLLVEKNLNNKNIILSNATQKIANYILTSNHVLAKHKSKQVKNYKKLNLKMPSELIQLTELIENSTKKDDFNKIDDKLANNIYKCKQITSEKITEKSVISSEKLSGRAEGSDEEHFLDSSNNSTSGLIRTKNPGFGRQVYTNVNDEIKEENENQQSQKEFKLIDNLSVDLISSKVAAEKSFKLTDRSW